MQSISCHCNFNSINRFVLYAIITAILGIGFPVIGHASGRVVGALQGASSDANCKQLKSIASTYKQQITLDNEGKSSAKIRRTLAAFEIPIEYETAPDTGIVEYRVYSKNDFDGDGRVDLVKQRCGAGYLPVCTISMKLSGGKMYTQQTVSLNLVNIRGRIFGVGVQVGKFAPTDKRDFVMIYRLSKHGASQVCQ